MPSKLFVNLKNIEYNLNEVKKHINSDVKCLAMIKANAYGIGAVELAKYIQKKDLCKYLGVAHVKEAITLRKNGITLPIITFTQILKNQIDDVINYDITPSISDIDILKILDKSAKNVDKTVKVHIKIDTGMSRLGFNVEDINTLIMEFNKTTNIEYEGIYTHFSCADFDENYTNLQIKKFEEALEIFKNNKFSFNIVHANNSAGILNYEKANYDMVRIGIIMYGYYPSESLKKKINLKEALKLVSPICEIKKIKKGMQVSYGKTFIATRDTTLAVLQIGYADGLSRGLSNRYEVSINSKKAKIVGNICMDMCMIDITDIKENIAVGDEVVIFDNGQEIGKIADILNTINYEILTGISDRVQRIYIE